MTRTVYLNGAYLPASEARISIFDRAVTFGDAIYEVAGVLDGRLVDFDHHVQRYFDSLEKLAITPPLARNEILDAFRQLIAQNHIDEGLVYLQVTRGEAERDFVWPDAITPNVFMFTQPKAAAENSAALTGITLVSAPDIRWARRDIKSVNLLGQVLAKKAAADAGAYEALLIDPDGYVTECGSSSFFIVSGELILTRPLSNEILPGVTRRAVLSLCATHGLRLVESKFDLKDVFAADEAFIIGASSYILPAVNVDGRDIGNGKPGELTRHLRHIYLDYARASLI